MRWCALFVGLLSLSSTGQCLADVNRFEFRKEAQGFGAATEIIRGRKLAAVSYSSRDFSELRFGWVACERETLPISIVSPRGERSIPDNITIIPMVSWRRGVGLGDQFIARVNLEWSVINRENYNKAKYFPAGFELEPGLIWQKNRGLVTRNIYRLTLYMPRMSSRHFGIEYVIDYYLPARPASRTFHDPDKPPYIPSAPLKATVVGKENWFVAWNVPTGYLRFSFNKGALSAKLNDRPGQEKPPIDWQLSYVYRRYK